MSRWRRGFRLAGVSWKVLVADPLILGVLFAGLVASLAISASLFLLLFRRFPEVADLAFPRYLIVLPIFWVGTIASSYCNVVVALMADQRLQGGDVDLGEASRVATGKLPRIVSWTLLSMAVGLVLQVIAERLKLGGVIASRLFGLAWGLATTFVVPVLALEDVGVGDTVKRSAAIFKAKWGESMVAQGTISLVSVAIVIPLTIAVLVLAAVSVPLAIVVGIVALGTTILVVNALDTVVDVALYRYAVDGAVLGAFTTADLEGSFTPKKGKGRGFFGR